MFSRHELVPSLMTIQHWYVNRPQVLEKICALTQADARRRPNPEESMSEYATLTGVKHLRVRGMAEVSYCMIHIAAGLNLMPAARVPRARIKARLRTAAAASQRLRLIFLDFQEQFAGLI
jgi:hypothetical protein